MRCEQVTDLLPQIVEAGGTDDPAVLEHTTSCLRCQAELARYRRLLRVLHQLRLQRPEPPPGVASDLVAALEEAVGRTAVRVALTGRRAAYAAGLAVAAGLGTGVALASRSRIRRVRLAG